MFRRLRDRWPLLLRPVPVLSLLVVCPALLWWLEPALACIFLGVMTPGMVLVARRGRSIWALPCHCWRFESLRTSRIVLLYRPGDDHPLEFWALARMVEREMDSLAGRFGFHLRRRVTVILLRDPCEVRQVYGRTRAGLAVICGKVIVVTTTSHLSLNEIVRHELAHLFSARWGELGPSLKSEGIATWLQKTEGGRPVDVAVLPYLRRRELRLPAMLKESFFRDTGREHACYLFAGSFTGFLIRRYGWDAYRRFYREATGRHFLYAFRRHFGMTLKDAEWHWRNELTVPEVIRRRARHEV